MSAIWLVVLTIGAIALIAAMYFGKARNAQADSNLREAERGAKHLREEMRHDPEFRED